MKIKNIISKGLAIGLLFNTSLSSLAGTLSDDGRYETFEGNDITINNILEEDKVDIEIEGNTLVNCLKYNSINDFLSFGGQLNDDGYIEIETDGSDFKNFFIKKESLLVKPNTEYTFFVEIAENTLVKDNPNMQYAFIFGDSHNINQPSLWSNQKRFSENDIGIHKFTLTTKDNFDDAKVGDRGFVSIGYSGKIKFRYMIIEGNHIDKDIPFFRGMKSIGENETGSHKLKVKYSNGNLYDHTKQLPYAHQTGIINSYTDGIGDFNSGSQNGAFQLNFNKKDFDISKDLYFSVNILESTNYSRYGIFCRQKNFGKVYGHKILDKSGIVTFKVPANTIDDDFMFLIYDSIENSSDENIKFKDITISYQNIGAVKHESKDIQIQLKEPLRGLPNGVKDRIIKRNGQWMIERNCAEIIFDGSENWYIVSGGIKPNSLQFGFNEGYNFIHNSSIISDNFKQLDDKTVGRDIETLTIRNNSYSIPTMYIRINKDKLETEDVQGLKKWLIENPTKVVYQLQNPIYEPLNIESTINLYLDTTHISNNSSIPCNMKVIVDRAINRSVESIELAKINPTIDNISKARYWTNLLKETTNKDSLQSEIANITKIEDLEIENKSISANMDVYVKSKNALSMSLSTNNIVFENFTGVDDMEKLNVINITINSSLPYKLNSYLVSEIKSSDGKNIIPKELLNIRLSGEADYKAFTNINEKLVLKDDCNKGNNNQFGIDLILRGSLAHKADLYKTIIKFEAEQK